MKRTFTYKLNIFLFLLPALILFVGILIAPIIMSAYYSFHEFNLVANSDMEYMGLENYRILFSSMLTNPNTGKLYANSMYLGDALGHSLILAALSTFIQLPLALIIALKLSKGIRGERFFLSVYFMPVLISTVVIGQLWLKIYNPDYGVLNVALRALGLESWCRIWLGDRSIALGAAFVPVLWQYVGYHMLLMYAGIKSVPPELREAGMLDGCTDGQLNRYIVIPYIKPILRISVIFAVTGSLKSFDLIYVLTNGGPVHATEVPSTLMINLLFLRNRYGMGSTIAVMLIILCFVFALLINMIFRKEKVV